MIKEIEFVNWLREYQGQISHPNRYSKTVITLSKDLRKYEILKADLYSINDSAYVEVIKSLYFDKEELKEKNKRGNHMYSRTFDLYIEFLKSINRDESLIKDVLEIQQNKNIFETERIALIESRLGQGKYRCNLLKYWKCCSVTGFSQTSFLVASHIKPWRDSSNEERLDVYNGLLLTPNLDKALDLGFISFRNDGKIIISQSLEEYHGLSINPNMSILNFKLRAEHKPYLKYHRDQILRD